MKLTGIVGVAVTAMFGLTGYLGLFKPRTVQRAVLSYYERNPSGNPMLPLMKTDAYIFILRFVGTLASLGFVASAIAVYLRFTRGGVE